MQDVKFTYLHASDGSLYSFDGKEIPRCIHQKTSVGIRWLILDWDGEVRKDSVLSQLIGHLSKGLEGS